MDAVIIDYGAGNVKSVQFALTRIGIEAQLSNDPNQIAAAERVIFPGQGAAKAAMEKLQQYKLDQLLPTLTQPVLGICLGMQLLCSHSQEGNTKGLGIISGEVHRFEAPLKVPQMGWNAIHHLKGRLFEGVPEASYMYLVHSYYVPLVEQTTATASYGINYSVALEKDNFFGVQFHPEKSSSTGQQILENFIRLKP